VQSGEARPKRGIQLIKSQPDKHLAQAFISRSTRKKLGVLKDLISSSDVCPLCWLIVKSVEGVFDPDELLSAQCFTNWELDGRAWRDTKLHPRTRRLHITWSHAKLKDSYLVFCTPQQASNIPFSDSRENFVDNVLFLGRQIDPWSEKKSLMRSWLDLCCKYHDGPCKGRPETTSDFGEMILGSFFGVIDVVDMRLTSLPYLTQKNAFRDDDSFASGDGSKFDPFHPSLTTKDQSRLWYEPYAALSYVWGNDLENAYMTTLENVLRHRRPGGLEEYVREFPKVTRDAIELVQRLGLRYLWVDHLCIVQKTRSFNLNCSCMDAIYGHAILTICAADGENSSAGLRAMHASTDGEGINPVPMANYSPDLKLMVSRPPEVSVDRSAWNKRAWTFQERLLSRRCLIFTEGRVYFQCRSTGMSEDIYADQKGAGWSLDLIRVPSRLLNEVPRRTAWFYLTIVPLYTIREISRPGDIIAAFKGVANVMEATLGSPIIFGLPTSHFDFALLWEPKERSIRRNSKDSVLESQNLSGSFPSWSWCGWMGSVMHYAEPVVGDCLINLNEWLLKHTWICWYIRDGRGDVRPIWSGKDCQLDQSTEGRWRGYGRRDDPDDGVQLREWSFKIAAPSVSTHIGSDFFESAMEYSTHSSSVSDDGGRPHPGQDSVIGREGGRQRENLKVDERRRGSSSPSSVLSSTASTVDGYGRLLKLKSDCRQHEFTKTISENPYRVVKKDSGLPDPEFPDQPMLQFWTFYKQLYVTRPEDDDTDDERRASHSLHHSLRRFNVADDNGDWCGVITLPKDFLRDAPAKVCHFIAISEAKAFTTDECDTWTYYIPKERHESEWDLFYVLMLHVEDTRWQRLGLGKVFQTAFTGCQWREIILG
jgi:hypothetical protein